MRTWMRDSCNRKKNISLFVNSDGYVLKISAAYIDRREVVSVLKRIFGCRFYMNQYKEIFPEDYIFYQEKFLLEIGSHFSKEDACMISKIEDSKNESLLGKLQEKYDDPGTPESTRWEVAALMEHIIISYWDGRCEDCKKLIGYNILKKDLATFCPKCLAKKMAKDDVRYFCSRKRRLSESAAV